GDQQRPVQRFRPAIGAGSRLRRLPSLRVMHAGARQLFHFGSVAVNPLRKGGPHVALVLSGTVIAGRARVRFARPPVRGFLPWQLIPPITNYGCRCLLWLPRGSARLGAPAQEDPQDERQCAPTALRLLS